MKERFIMRKFDSKRKGFTLVELLIVIVVIGILSAMMMLSSSEAVSSARATTIVADLRNLKTAALALYTDNIDDYSKATIDNDKKPDMAKLQPYLTSGKDANTLKTEGYTILTNDNGWFVGYEIKGTNVDKIKAKLLGRAKSVGLLWSSGLTTSPAEKDTADKCVFMRAR